MPRYTRSKNKKLVRKQKDFKHPYQLIHFLQTANEKQFKPFKDKAREYLSGDTTPPVKLQTSALQKIALLHPKKLTPHAVSDFNGNDALGGGVGSSVAVINNQIKHLLGIDKVQDAVFGVNKPAKLQTLDSQFAAYLVDQTYSKINDRPDTTLGRFKRMPKYDTDHVSVWKNTFTGEMTVSIRGTKLEAADILADAKILFGETQTDSKELDNVLDQLEYDYPRQKYNIAAHSLGTAFVAGQKAEHGAHFNEVFMFNPASSPGQSNDYETTFANDDQYHWYINHGDMVSNNLLQFMDEDTVNNRVQFGHYYYSPVAAHSVSQWFPTGFNTPYFPDEMTLPPQDPSMDTAEYQQDNEQTQAENLS